MQVRPILVGLILFGVLVLGGTLDGVRRKFMQQPLWASQNWRSLMTGAAIWLAVGALAVLAGVLGLLL